jgi:hypothetical protein
MDLRQLDGSSPGDADFEQIDAGPVTSSSCEQADGRFSVALGRDPILTQFASCTLDTDCVLWSASIRCANGASNAQCAHATNAANVVQAEARRDVVAASTYCAPGEPVCHGGASCAPLVARCIERTCTARIEEPDAGR